MRGLLTAVVLAFVALAIWLVAFGGARDIGQVAMAYQRDFQNQIALALRGVRAGQAEALWLLIGACFAYGFVHAAGPGHGKVLIGGYGLGRQVALVRLSLVSVLASLGQAVTAVVLVHGGLWLFGLGREQLTGVADRALAPVSYGVIVLIGAWLLVRGLRRLMRGRVPHGHAVEADGHCTTCGHRHGPSLEEVQSVRSAWEAAMLIGGIALRPCTGALFVLVITWQMGIAGAGIAGTFAMAAGTALLTVLVAAGAVGLRGSMMGSLADAPLAARVVPVIEIAAGLLVVLAAGTLFVRAI